MQKRSGKSLWGKIGIDQPKHSPVDILYGLAPNQEKYIKFRGVMMKANHWQASVEDVLAVVEARHGDPFGIMGPHEAAGGIVIRAFVPHAETLEVIGTDGKSIVSLERRHDAGFFEGFCKTKKRFDYRLRAANSGGSWELHDPYAFPAYLGSMDDYLLREGTHRKLYERLGAHIVHHCGVDGVNFAVWAPNAQRVSVVGDFNGWDGRRHQMRNRADSGIWEIFAPGLTEGTTYKFEIIGAQGQILPLKADPFGLSGEFRPSTASVVTSTAPHPWGDARYLEARAKDDKRRTPMSTYEVHLGSWRRGEDNRFLTYDELADQLIPYAVHMGFTHIELLPVSEHPLDASWGYQPVGLFAPSRRFGDPAGFARFVDKAHQAGIGIILDWVPAHFPTDQHGLRFFDGTALYEHQDPRQGFHPDWNTAIFNFGRVEVANILAANALFWMDRFHVDGLRVDAVASMLYLDYSRRAGEWIPNEDGGNENKEAVAFLRRVNELVYAEHPGAVTIAEESTAWPGVSQPAYAGGLGFGFKWNMGWMHDTLAYMSREPVHRKHHHSQMTFGLLYAFSENFVLPLSHDEVVHGKGSILGKMPGDEWQKFANVRAYYGFMWGHPGKKLLFMGQEFAQGREWAFEQSLDWHVIGDSGLHHGVQNLVRDLNHAYRTVPALHARDCEYDGFRWVVADDAEQSVFAWLRFGGPDDAPVLCISNFTPVPRSAYRIGLPKAGQWREIINSDAAEYGGSNLGNLGGVKTQAMPAHGMEQSAEFVIPPLATMMFLFNPA
jgi:1,4-alpha-glucan branching enzyme